MNTQPEFQLPPPNPVTRAAHRREVYRQITLPLIGVLLLLLIVVGAIIWAAASGQAESGGGFTVSRWADVSLIWLIMPSLFFSLLCLAANGGFIYLLYKLLSVLPGYARLTQDFFERIKTLTRQYADKAVEPVFKTESFWAGFKRLRGKK